DYGGLDSKSLRTGTGGLPRLRGDKAGLAAAAYAADVADQRARRDHGGRGDRDRGRAAQHPGNRARHAGRGRRGEQRGRRLSDHGPDAADVPRRRQDQTAVSPQATEYIIELAYISAVVLFVLALRWLSAPSTARKGVLAGEIGMALAIAATLLYHGIVSYQWIAVGLVVGAVVGVPLGMVPMT